MVMSQDERNHDIVALLLFLVSLSLSLVCQCNKDKDPPAGVGEATTRVITAHSAAGHHQ